MKPAMTTAACLASSSPTMAAARRASATANKVVVRDPAAYARKKAKLIEDGPSKLQLLLDWDFTCTHFTLLGRRACSCHKTIEDCDLLPQPYHE